MTATRDVDREIATPGGCGPSERRQPVVPVVDGRPSYSGRLVRPDDQVRIDYRLYNGIVNESNRIVALEPEEPIYYVLSFGSQHTVEDAISTDGVPPVEPRRHRRALPSRIAVTVPKDTKFTVGNLLALANYAIHVDPRANGIDKGGLSEFGSPALDETAIHVPASLVLTPIGAGIGAGRFRQVTGPANGSVHEIWRARLEGLTAGAVPGVRAVAHLPHGSDFPDYLDRLEGLPPQTTGRRGVPIDARELTLSSDGATIDLDGAWQTGDIVAYQHRAITGRDLYVRVVVRGFLAPFGIPASLITVAERDLRDDKAGQLTASLVEDLYFTVDPTPVSYAGEFAGLMPHAGRRLPFTAMRAVDTGDGPVTKKTLVLANGKAIRRDNACLLARGRRDVQVVYRATDRVGNEDITFELPAVFVSADSAFEVGGVVLSRVSSWFANSAGARNRMVELGGQPVAWADPTTSGGAGSVHATNRMQISLDLPSGDPATVRAQLEALGRPAFHPGVDVAWIVDTAAASAFGDGGAETEVVPAPRWLEHGTDTDDNADLAYLDVTGDPAIATPSTEAAGMLGTSLNIGSFGQFLGGGMKFDDGDWNWNPAAALGGLPRLLGKLSLAELIAPIQIGGLDTPDGLPGLSVELQFDEPDDQTVPTGARLRFVWEPDLRSHPAADPVFVVTDDFDDPLPRVADVFGGAATRAVIEVTTCLPQNSTSVSTRLERFGLLLPPASPAVAITFRHVAFEMAGRDASVDTDIADWAFVGPLGWLEPLKDLIAGLLGNGKQDFSSGIAVDYAIPVPGFSIGIVGVRGLRVDLELDFPDTGASSVALAVGERDDPFRITLFGCGGDGSFGLEVDAESIVLIEGSLAVTYEMSVDVFIASASLSASVGVYVEYALEDGEPDVVLGAYAELRGSVSVLGLLEISGSVTVSLEYDVGDKLLTGTAEVTGEVSSIFGKKEVSHDVSVEISLGGSGTRALAAAGARMLAGAFAPDDDPGRDLSFGDHFSLEEWEHYCDAFAA